MMTQHPAWLLIVLGLVMAAVGVIWLAAPLIPWLGRLPGDIAVERGASSAETLQRFEEAVDRVVRKQPCPEPARCAS